MRSKLNIFLWISFIAFLTMLCGLYYIFSHPNVGDAQFDKNIDNSSFKTCYNRAYQYYDVNTNYVGERKAIRDSIFTYLDGQDLNFGAISGYITFRFIVNCNGEIGRFRYKQVDENYLETSFVFKEIEKLQNAIKSLKKWNVGALSNGAKVDSYYQIHFKINKGKIIDIF